MKLLYVYGDDDYAALKWEGTDKQDRKTVIHELNHSKSKTKEFYPGCYVELKEFATVDKEFVSFINLKILDYDHCKHKNFYIL